MDALKYTGPVALAGDCTKVRKRLTFSNDYGSHILGAVLPLEKCTVKDTNDIEDFVSHVSESQDLATQVRAILVKVRIAQGQSCSIPLVLTLLRRYCFPKFRLLSSRCARPRAMMMPL